VLSTASLTYPVVALAVSPDGSRLYVAEWTSNPNLPNALLQAFDITGAQAQEIGQPLPIDSSQSMAITPDGRTLFAADANSVAVTVVDTGGGATNPLTQGQTVAIGGAFDASNVFLSPDATKLYSVMGAIGQGSCAIAVVDVTTLALEPGGPYVVQVEGDSATAGAHGSFYVWSVISAQPPLYKVTPTGDASQPYAVSATFALGAGWFVADATLSADGSCLHVLATDNYSSKVVALESDTLVQIPGEVALDGGEGREVALSADGAQLFAADVTTAWRLTPAGLVTA
jgi:DNA-binding beta-propeller fold protein YncE